MISIYLRLGHSQRVGMARDHAMELVVLLSQVLTDLYLSPILISCAEDFLNFTKKFNEDAAKSSQTNEPPINVCYLKRNDIERVTEDLLTECWNKNKSKSFLLLQ